jgi:hypothetical protein
MEQEAPVSTQILKESVSKRELKEKCDNSPANDEAAARA